MVVTRKIEEFSFTAPLSSPVETEALRAGDENAPWRLVVFPGTPCRKELFYRMLRVTPDDIETIVVARPGFGKTAKDPVLEFSEQIRTIQPFLGEKHTIVLGVSYGGALALAAALENPKTVHGVVTVAALVTEPFDYARWLADLGGEPWVKDLVPRRLHNVRAEVEGRRTQIGPLLERVQTLDVPIEVVHGDFDSLVGLTDATKLLVHLPEGTGFDKVPGGTHYLELQYPRRLYAAVRRAMDRHEAGLVEGRRAQ